MSQVQQAEADHKATATTHAVAAIQAAPLPDPLPENVKAVIRSVVTPLTSALIDVLVIGVDAALDRIPFVGGIAKGVVNPILNNLQPALAGFLNRWLE